MTMNIETPLLDAALLSLGPVEKNRRYASFLNAKADIAQAIEAKHIWNVDYVAAKSNLNDGVRYALETIMDQMREVFWKAQDVKAASPRWDYAQKVMAAHDHVSSYIQLNHCAGKVKLLKKAALPEYDPYIAMIEEAAYLHTMAEQARKFKVMGRKPSENPVEVDITNTGHCAICANRQKMTKAQEMVHHGFQITWMGKSLGHRVGSCFGVGYKPRELSCEANIAYIPVLEKALVKTEKWIEELVNSVPATLETVKWERQGSRSVQVPVSYDRGSKEYNQLRAVEKAKAEGQISMLKQDIEVQREIVKNWKPKKFDWAGA